MVDVKSAPPSEQDHRVPPQLDPMHPSNFNSMKLEFTDKNFNIHQAARAMQEMMKTEGWQLYVRLIRSRVMVDQSLFAGAISPTQQFAQEFAKGAINGRLWCLGLPESICADAAAQMHATAQPEGKAPAPKSRPATRVKEK